MSDTKSSLGFVPKSLDKLLIEEVLEDVKKARHL